MLGRAVEPPLMRQSMVIGVDRNTEVPMYADSWPHPPFYVADYPALLELLGPDEFERVVCPFYVARERRREWREGYGQIKD